MRNVLQLLGGVVVAGAVAAGSTAFTAAGVTNTISGSQLVGGAISQNVHGAKLTKLALQTDPAAPTQVMGTVSMDLETDAGAPLAATDIVTVAFTGATASTGTVGAIAPCAKGSNKVWTCAITGYYTNVTAVAVTVAPAVASVPA